MSDQPKLSLSNELVQAIGDYLITRPYREVAMLISGLQQEVQANVQANGATKPPAEQGEFTSTGDLQ